MRYPSYAATTVALHRQSVQRLVDLKTSQKEATEKVGLEAERWVCFCLVGGLKNL